VARCCRQAPVGPRGGVGYGGEGMSAPERWVDGEAAQAASSGSGGAPVASGDDGVALQLKGGREG
jgi:hypothetical protein